MGIYKIDNVFSEKQLELINYFVKKNKVKKDSNGDYPDREKDYLNGNGIDKRLGRLQYGIKNNDILQRLKGELENSVNGLFNSNLYLSSITYAEYSAEFGEPNLPIHWDHDDTEIIFNYQLDSTTNWEIGVDKNVYVMENNSALIFNPNAYTHWRPIKTFIPGEYVRMIFFRFKSIDGQINYKSLDYSVDHEIFDEIREFRNNFKSSN